MAFQFEIAGSQIDGDRDYQEDAFLITHLSDTHSEEPGVLVIVADGMGGHAAGNVASNMAVQAFNKTITSGYPTEDMSSVLNESILKANKAIAETIEETQALDGMGCTMVGAVIAGNKLWWASVGDSHLYLLRDKKLTKLNADHSYGGFMDRMAAQNTPVEPEPGLSRNMLMSALTGKDIAEIDCQDTPFELEHNDKIILCSDGVDTLTHGKIIQYSEWAESAKECSEALLSAVEEEAVPRQDNTTAVAVFISDSAIIGADEAAVEEVNIGSDTLPAPEAPLLEAEAEYVEEAPPPAQEPPPPPPAEPVFKAQVPDEEVVPAKSKTSLIVGIAAIFMIAAVAGVYFMFGDKILSTVSKITEVSKTTEPAPKDAIVEVKPKPKPETAPVVKQPPDQAADLVDRKKTVPETTVPAVADTPPKVQPGTRKAVAPPVKKEFQDNLKSGGKAPVMMVIPAGTFEMGSPNSSRFADERPRRTVTMVSFAAGKYEVTFAEYERFVKATGGQLPKDYGLDRKTHPVIYVNWDDAYNYTQWLSRQTGKKYRLLSESEWEYVASTGVKTPFWWGFSAEPGKAHCFDCDTGFDPNKPTKIGRFEANKFGLHDTAGNVAEWVQDCWHKNYKAAPPTGEVWQGGDCTNRVIRGGAYLSPSQSIRHTKRDYRKSNNVYDHVGFRLARDLD